ncbi:serine hydrolase domain-containing protein [Chitinophaga niabensis]|uniref:CubicO group peptidase, beta-lactamase class C family n=1 Tax=Chitinophaga niabensis TaxID=536979 RepID=A0A1N6JHR7_9BACT|nr:serine hydrolase domain-containing protein [Chitinophaga niabensis]SIO43739.1 CubicO group peptidase, beta-lactamase class C family [Chitinophaga niabensis]
MKTFALFILSCIISVSTYAQTWQDTLAKIESAFSRYTPETPGAQFTISRNGEIIFSKAWGIADLEHHVPLTTRSLIEAGSVSKQFTAAAILLLEQQGKLSLNDDVHKYIPELPDYGTPITLRQMMNHTSGLRDWGSIAELSGSPRGTKTYNNADALWMVCRQKELNNVPGAEYIYSNSNYLFLAIIVKRVTGRELSLFTRRNIFDPAGMKQSLWRAYKEVVPGRAMAYAQNGAKYINEMPNEDVYGPGGLLTTTEELVKWVLFYTGGKLGNPSLFPEQTKKTPLNNGNVNDYTAGLVLTRLNGQDAIVHSGATASYRANLEYFPEQGLVFAFLSNTSAFDSAPTNAASLARNIFVPEPAGSPSTKPAVPPYAVTEEKLRSYEGWYRNPRNGAGTKVVVTDGKLGFMGDVSMTALGKDLFRAENRRIEFLPGGFRQTTPNKDTVFFTAVEFANINKDSDAARYTGEYYSEETEFRCFIEAEGTTLKLVLKPETKMTLTPQYKDGFRSPWGSLYFVRDAQNKITGFKVSQSRARNVSFIKVK